MQKSYAINSLEEGETMGSENNDDGDNPLDPDPSTDVLPATGPTADQPTEEIVPPEASPIADLPTINMNAVGTLDLPRPEPTDAGVEQSVGMFLSDDEEPEKTVGIFLEEENLREVESTMDDILAPDDGMAPSETIGRFLEMEDQAKPSINEAETLIRKDTPWKQLHPVSLAVNLLPRAWQTVRSMWPILLVILYDKDEMGMRFIDIGVILFFALTSVGNTFIH